MLPITFGRLVAAAKGSEGNVSSRVGFFASGVATYIHILRISYWKLRRNHVQNFVTMYRTPPNIKIYVNRKLVFYYVVLRINNRQEFLEPKMSVIYRFDCIAT